MGKLPNIGKYPFRAEPFRCDFTKHLFIGNLGNDLLNTADFHSNDRGYGVIFLQSIHKTWVLSRLAIELEKVPYIYEKFNIETWVDSVMRFFTSRNFKISNDEGTIFGYGKSIWAMIDTDSRQPIDILEVNNGVISQYLEKDYFNPIEKLSRVKIGENLQLVKTLEPKFCDIDINGHVNSIKYIEHIFDLFPLKIFQTKRVKRLEIAYITESHIGEVLHFYTDKAIETEQNEIAIRITKDSEEGEIEVCRSKVVFCGI